MRIVPFALLIAGCVAYRAAPQNPREMAEEFDRREPGRLDFAAAVAWARKHNPDLRRLEALARAEAGDVPATEARASGEEEMAEVMLDPLAVALLAQRGRAFELADTRRLAMLAERYAEERRLIASIAETFLLHRYLAGRAAPAIPLDGGAFEKAGLLSASARAGIDFASTAARAEALAIAAGRRSNLARLRRLLGLGDNTPLDLVVPEGEFPPLPEPSRLRLLARPELSLALARYAVADAALRLAVAEQWPTLELGGRLTFDGNALGGLVALTLPIGASARARAAGDRREAERHALEAAILDAEREAEEARALWSALEADAAGKQRGADAMLAMFEASLARLETDADGLEAAVEVAGRLVRDVEDARVAGLEAIRARVACARAYGWPDRKELP